MAGISMLSALEIASNYPDNILISSVQSKDNDKWAGFMYMLRDGDIHKLMVNSDAVFDTEKASQDYFTTLCEHCKENFLKKDTNEHDSQRVE